MQAVQPNSLFPDNIVDVLFGLQIDVSTHRNQLDAASTFSKIRNQIDGDRMKLRTLTAHSLHRSTKKKTFQNAVKNAVEEGKLENKILITLVQEALATSAQASPLDLFILVCFSLTGSHYKQLKDNDLIDICPRLLLAVFKDVTIATELRNMFIKLIEHVCNEKDEHSPPSEYRLVCTTR
jgi:hypothetical protein